MSIPRWTGVCLLWFLIAGCATMPTPASADVGVSFGLFYSNLSPHGQWLVSGSYGRVWQPAVYTSRWNPYYDGHWVYTDLGWTWVSDYPWGAVPYHYGTWVVDADYGWVWVPGYVWAPAWVVFRTGPAYIGWAPVPVGYTVGMSLASVSSDPGHFVFVAHRDFLAPRVRTRVVPATTARTVINYTKIENTIRIENNVVVNAGPDVTHVQRASGRRIEAQSIERVPRVGPARRVTRADLRVDAARAGGRLRAAEPISERESEAVIDRDRREPRGASDRERKPRLTVPQTDHGRRNPVLSPSADPQMLPDDGGAVSTDESKSKPDAKAKDDSRRKPRTKKNKEKPKPPPKPPEEKRPR